MTLRIYLTFINAILMVLAGHQSAFATEHNHPSEKERLVQDIRFLLQFFNSESLPDKELIEKHFQLTKTLHACGELNIPHTGDLDKYRYCHTHYKDNSKLPMKGITISSYSPADSEFTDKISFRFKIPKTICPTKFDIENITGIPSVRQQSPAISFIAPDPSTASHTTESYSYFIDLPAAINHLALGFDLNGSCAKSIGTSFMKAVK